MWSIKVLEKLFKPQRGLEIFGKYQTTNPLNSEPRSLRQICGRKLAKFFKNMPSLNRSYGRNRSMFLIFQKHEKIKKNKIKCDQKYYDYHRLKHSESRHRKVYMDHPVSPSWDNLHILVRLSMLNCNGPTLTKFCVEVGLRSE